MVPRAQTLAELEEALQFHLKAAEGIRAAIRALTVPRSTGVRRWTEEQRALHRQRMVEYWERRHAAQRASRQ